MKKIISILISLTWLLLTSCMDKDRPESMDKGTFRLSYTVVDQETETKTKASVPAEEGEEKLNSLYLLFFDYTENGSGNFVTHYEVTDNLSMDGSIQIPFKDKPKLDNGKSYVILAVANIEGAEYINDTPALWIENVVSHKNESQTVETLMAYANGVHYNETDNSHAIKPSELLMSGRTFKYADNKEVTLELTRALVRFDVQNLNNERFDVVSVSIWNAPVSAPVWAGEKYDIPQKLERYYGIKREPSAVGEKLPQIKGGLYAYENFVSSPKADDKETTCLIVGIIPKWDALKETEKNIFTEDKITYHRINVHPEDGGQNTKRNNVYKVSINKIRGEGADDEHDAWSKGTNNLDLIVNNWNLDDNGMVLTDGKNTLVIPVKRVILSPAGDQREYSIYTLGEGEPYISKTDLPAGIAVTLQGNRLNVVATPMPQGADERKGMVEIALGSLRGEINFIQTENVEEYLTLNLSQLSSFPAIGVNALPDGYIEVTSSGDWTAKIYNNSADLQNPGFAFNIVQSGGSPQTELNTQDNFGSNHVQIYTTGNNEDSSPRYAFVIFSLIDNPEVNRSLALIQSPTPKMIVDPGISSFTFGPTGEPVLTPLIEDRWVDGWFEFSVNPGMDEYGSLNPWQATLDNNNFEIKIENTLTDPKQRVLLKSKGKNLTGARLQDVLTIGFPGSTTDQVKISISQAALGLTLNFKDQLNFTAKGGLLNGGVRVVADESLTYSVQIVSSNTLANADTQGIYLVADDGTKVFDNTKITGRNINDIIKVGAAKLLTPNVNIDVEATIRVALEGYEEFEGMWEEFTVTQSALTPKNLLAVNLSADRGSLIASNTYNSSYKAALTNTDLFGPNGTIYMPNIFPIPKENWTYNNTATIDAKVNHFNANLLHFTTETTSNRIFEWLNTYEGILVINYDFNGYTTPFQQGKLLNMLGYEKGNPSGDPKVNTDSKVKGSKVYNYILGGGGPFGPANPTSFSHDGERVVLTGYPDTAIPLIIDKNGAQILIDPVNRVVFNGELQIFDNSNYNFTTPSTDNHKFLANYIAFIHNVAMYGSHFTDHFLDEVTTKPPYDYKK